MTTISLFTVDGFFYKYDQETTTEVIKRRINKGRSGLMLTICGMFFLYYGASIVIPMPTTEQENIIKQTIQKQHKEKR